MIDSDCDDHDVRSVVACEYASGLLSTDESIYGHINLATSPVITGHYHPHFER